MMRVDNKVWRRIVSDACVLVSQKLGVSRPDSQSLAFDHSPTTRPQHFKISYHSKRLDIQHLSTADESLRIGTARLSVDS
jgi:hypothetical protein